MAKKNRILNFFGKGGASSVKTSAKKVAYIGAGALLLGSLTACDSLPSDTSHTRGQQVTVDSLTYSASNTTVINGDSNFVKPNINYLIINQTPGTITMDPDTLKYTPNK